MKLGKLYRRIQQLQTPLNPILEDVLKDSSLQAQIVDLNQSQLYDQGIQADGTPTGDYAQITIDKYKPLAGYEGRDSRSDHITGKDTGETYDSMKVSTGSEGFVITADDRNDFFEREPKGLGLTTESLNEILPEIKESFIQKYKKAIAFA